MAEQITHLRGWLDPDIETQVVEIRRTESVFESNHDSYYITFIDQYGMKRSAEFTKKQKDEVMSGRFRKVRLTTRRVVTGVQVISD